MSKPENYPKPVIFFSIFVFILSACRQSGTPELLKPPFEYYGWIYVSYTQDHNDLARISSYTNTGFATTAQQVKILEGYGFENIIYLFNESAILETVWKNEGRQPPAVPSQELLLYEQEIPGFREKFFSAYKEYMQGLKDSLLATDAYDQVDVFYIADEPALHMDVYLDQAFLDEYADVFKEIFPDKKSAITFAQALAPRVGAGPHYDPPANLDLVIVNPYFIAKEIGLEETPCDREKIRQWIYQDNPVSSIGWTKQFGKPILIAGDAQLKANQRPEDCYLTEMYAILQEDPAVAGLIWFIYDREYEEGGYIRGAANNPDLVKLIENLGR